MLALAMGRSQLPVARGCSQERSTTSRHLHWHPQSLSPPLFLHLSSPPLSFLFHSHPITKPLSAMKTQRQDANDGSLVLPVLSLAMWVRVVDATHGGSLPALPSCRDFSLWVQFRRSERDFPVGSQHLGGCGWPRLRGGS